MERQDSSEMDNSIVRVADETAGEGGAEIANDKTGKIKFKRAKKLGKKVGGQYSKAMGDAKNSRFHVSLAKLSRTDEICLIFNFHIIFVCFDALIGLD